MPDIKRAVRARFRGRLQTLARGCDELERERRRGENKKKPRGRKHLTRSAFYPFSSSNLPAPLTDRSGFHWWHWPQNRFMFCMNPKVGG